MIESAQLVQKNFLMKIKQSFKYKIKDISRFPLFFLHFLFLFLLSLSPQSF